MVVSLPRAYIDFALHLAMGIVRKANSIGLGNALEPGRNIYPVAEDVVLLDDHVTEVNADAELNPLLCWSVRVAPGHAALDLRSAPDRINHARELGKEAVARVLDYPGAPFRDLRIVRLLRDAVSGARASPLRRDP